LNGSVVVDNPSHFGLDKHIGTVRDWLTDVVTQHGSVAGVETVGAIFSSRSDAEVLHDLLGTFYRGERTI